MRENLNFCKCKTPIHPDNLPVSIFEYKGTANCGNCGETINYPISNPNIKIATALTGNPVIDFIQEQKESNNKKPTAELAMVFLLSEIAGLLKANHDLLKNLNNSATSVLNNLGPETKKPENISKKR